MKSGVTVVVPTLGRPSLTALLDALAGRVDVIVVDDRPAAGTPLGVPPWATVIGGPARGPAAARNAGWRAAGTEWVAFLDDDVLPDPDWPDRLDADLAGAPRWVGGVQGRVRVPLPGHRRPTDWERVTAGLADGAWITADMAYRRAALARTGGFDERLPRAFREDAELAFRVREAGWTLRRGTRRITHPVRTESPWVSVRTQRGNADDALLRHLYGRDWRRRLDVPPGRRRRHALTTAAGVTALLSSAAALATRSRPGTAAALAGRSRSEIVAAIARRSRSGTAAALAGRSRLGAAVALLGGAAWVAGTAEFAAARIAPGPRDPREVATMLATSVVIPPMAVAHWLRGWWRWRGATPMPAGPAPEAGQARARTRGVHLVGGQYPGVLFPGAGLVGFRSPAGRGGTAGRR